MDKNNKSKWKQVTLKASPYLSRSSIDGLNSLPSSDARIEIDQADSRIRILHIVNDLAVGGSEMMLYKLLSRTNRERFAPAVISLNGLGILSERIRGLRIPVFNLGIKPAVLGPLPLMRLAHLTRRLRPQLIQGWMYHGNLAAQFAGMFARKPVDVVWNIRQSFYSLADEKPATAWAIKVGAHLSSWPSMILNNSRGSVQQHAGIGYRLDRSAVIPNGFDTEDFVPSKEAHASVRAELGVPGKTVLIGRIGRYHHTKDYPTFLHAASLLLGDYPLTQFVLVGKHVDWDNAELRNAVRRCRLVERVHLLGERMDIPRLTAALDIATSSSHAEGFPNVIGEAMSCEVPCVVTQVGDSQLIVGNAGRVVPPTNAGLLSHAWKELIELGYEGRRTLGTAARARVLSLYSLTAVVDEYESVYNRLLATSRNKPGQADISATTSNERTLRRIGSGGAETVPARNHGSKPFPLSSEVSHRIKPALTTL